MGSTSNAEQNLFYKFWNKFQFECFMNIKGVQTLWEKSGKFTKILSQLVLHKSEFNWAHCMQDLGVPRQVFHCHPQ
jgi:hypothetical protein